MNATVERVAAILTEANAASEITTLPEAAPNAASAAAQLGCDVAAIANSLVFDGDGAPVLVIASGGHRVETAKVAALVGASAVTRATPDFVREATGQPIGGVAPVGHPQAITTVVDTRLANHPHVWAAAGHPRTVFRTTFDELVAMTDGSPADIGA
ncbi:prolyl-tRNA editing enzyme YbaK/EbsC (Cys-tRNA(Pro) deacylase) [Lipingzhangella halophila]|uniref:Prolyl-tRNA editing enzyme YbaK/EbsC (Cys-tRNA(Pro) deacylase) n=1 Tax=Lipingzhangella halophila TaxID=1783352 RepID=A0A7W7RHD7_9ACTN|nr:YbaK/EbsC family protein [Lipingzhangella halophila]MBB4931658.1 prolyl-tRNA editing enzyme YbaK/EbsC (Cys-tRNA(Pro) deacylase) [Lipingzhangella halophila]